MATWAPAQDENLAGFGYERVSRVGRGHYASAQLVRDIATGQTFVAKCISLAALSEHDHGLAHQEVFLLQELQHPFVVAYRDSFVIDAANVLVIVMEYCDGGDLRKLIDQKAGSGEHFHEDQVMEWFVQILLALRYIHSEKVLHRDLKTSNIFLSNGSSTIKLGDFGISRVLEGTTDAAVTMVGTPYYMSPEVCRNERYSWKSDIWSLGCILYELCMLKHAFESTSLFGLVYKIVSEHYEPLPPMYSQELNGLVRQLLTKSEQSRPSIEELLSNSYVSSYLAVHSSLVSSSAASRNVPPPTPPSNTQPGTLQAAGAAAEVADTPSSITCPMEPQVEVLVLASRIRHRLVVKKLNWISELAAFDQVGDGALAPVAMETALAKLDLGLSCKEIATLVAALAPDSRAKILLADFEAKLLDAGTLPDARRLGAWARQLLSPFSSRVALLLRARDLQRSGMLPVADFQAALQELMPGIIPDHLAVLVLLADKNLYGDVDYMHFADTFGAPPPPPPRPDVVGPSPPAAGRAPEAQEGEAASKMFTTCTEF